MGAPGSLPPPPPLELLVEASVAVFVDFDGTLVEIAPTPDAIEVPEDLGPRLAALSDRLGGRLAVVSGRAIENLEQHCGALRVACAGSHGAERRGADGALAGVPQALPAGIAAQVAAWAKAQGVLFETKPQGAALHSRARPEMEEDCAAFLAGLAQRHGLAVKQGKRVAELVCAGVDKGAAVRSFMSDGPFAGSLPVFIGDDVTDEDGFAAAADLGGFGIAVGSRISKNARYALADPAAVQHWLGL